MNQARFNVLYETSRAEVTVKSIESGSTPSSV
jgi:hypothetical protein